MRSNRLGYGSHSILNEYIFENKCKRIMEIGVADGENARSMVEVAIQNFLSDEVEYYGFDFFDDDSKMKQIRQKLEETGCRFRLFKGDSVETLHRIVKTLPKMDLIFIDGGHSYETVKNDWENSKTLIHERTAVFFHNYNFSGVKRLVDSISREEYQVKIIHPPSDCDTAFVKKRNIHLHRWLFQGSQI
jgi:predicted O-methyltransferase YrrM